METTKNLVTISDYMKSRRYNQKLYSRLVEAIETKVGQIPHLSPDLEITISMSAKYQTPYVSVSENDVVPFKMGHIEDAIFDALDEVGFTNEGVEDKGSYYRIDFAD